MAFVPYRALLLCIAACFLLVAVRDELFRRHAGAALKASAERGGIRKSAGKRRFTDSICTRQQHFFRRIDAHLHQILLRRHAFGSRENAVEIRAVYADMPVDVAFAENTCQGLGSRIAPLSREDALNFLLHFTQSAFRYQTDGQQFGRERSLFPEETFYYPYSDCEDRAIFFSWLVRRLLKQEIVLLH